MEITIDKSLILLMKEVRDEQKRFFKLTVDAKKKKAPGIWNARKECLESCRQLESYLDSKLEAVLNGADNDPDNESDEGFEY